MPVEASEILLQLIFWLPNDNRLWWLWAEVLNARRSFPAAADIMVDLVQNRRLDNVQELFQHRRILTEAVTTWREITKTPHFASELLWAVQPRGGLLVPGAGSLGYDSVASFRTWYESQTPPPPPAPARALPDWRTIIVAFVGGCMVTILVRLQMNQWRRPLPVQATPDDEDVPPEEPAPEEPTLQATPGQPESLVNPAGEP